MEATVKTLCPGGPNSIFKIVDDESFFVGADDLLGFVMSTKGDNPLISAEEFKNSDAADIAAIIQKELGGVFWVLFFERFKREGVCYGTGFLFQLKEPARPVDA